MIDVHCHLLPGVDDGPASMDEAIALARLCVASGIRAVICTPHVYPGRWNNTHASLTPALADFRVALAENQIGLDLHLGGEVRITDRLLDQLDQNELPFMGEVKGYRILLLEMPDAIVPVGLPMLVRQLMHQRIRPLIAHPERNKAVQARPAYAREFTQMGCWLQLTAGSLIGQFGRRVQTLSEALIEDDLVYLLASDCHNSHARVPNLGAAQEKLAQQYGKAYANLLCATRPGELCGVPA